MAGEKKMARGMTAPICMCDDAPFQKGLDLFNERQRKQAMGDLLSLERDARSLLGAALPALTGLQTVIKNDPKRGDLESIMRLARQIAGDTETFKGRLDGIKSKFPTTLDDQTVISSLHIATELQQWTEDWSNVVTPMINSVENILEKKDV